jgi:hypothetical protein
MSEPSNPPANASTTSSTPDTPPPRKRKWISWIAIGAAVFLVLLLVWFGQKWYSRCPDSTTGQKPEKLIWLDEVKDADSLKNRPLRALGVQYEVSHDCRTPESNEAGGFTRNQVDIEKYIRSLGMFHPRITLGGKKVQIPESQSKVGEDPTLTGYRLDSGGGGYEVYTVQRSYHAAMVSEILFTVQNQHIWPGSLLSGGDFVKVKTDEKDAQIVPLPAFDNTPNGGRAPVKLTIYGISQASDLPKAERGIAEKAQFVNLLMTTKDVGDGQKSKQVSDPYILDNPSRESYERALRTLIPKVQLVANMSEITEITTSSEDLMFQLGASASFAYTSVSGAVSGSIQKEENVDRAMVYMLIRQAAYTVAVDSPPPPSAGWFTPNAPIGRIKNAMKSPPIYCDSVTYGRTALLLAKSEQKSSEVKKALRAAFSANFGIASGNATVNLDDKTKQTLSSTSFNIILYGGKDAAKGEVANTQMKFDDAMAYMSRWKNAEFKAKDALPIAFSVRYLADHRPAGFVGLHPHRIFESNKVSPKYQVVLEQFHSGNDADHVIGFLGLFGKGSRIVVMSSTNGIQSYKNFRRHFDTGDFPVNSGLDGDPGVGMGSKFKVELRFGAKDGDDSGNDWQSMRKCKWYTEKVVEVDLNDLPKDKIIRREFDLNGENRMTVSVRIIPPSVPELPNPPELRAFAQSAPVEPKAEK